MSKTVKKLWLIGALIILMAALFGVRAYLKQKNKDVIAADSADEISEESSKHTVFESDQQEILVLRVKYKDENFSFYVDDSGKWVLSGDSEFPLDDSVVSLMLTSLQKITSDYRYDDIEDLSQYGLDDPEVTITVDMGDDPIVIKVGDQYPYGSSRYITVSDIPGAVFVAPADLYTRFAKTRAELIKADPLPHIDSSRIAEILFSVDGYVGYDLFCDAAGAYDRTGCDPWCIFMEDGRFATAPAQKLDTLFSDSTSFVFSSVADYERDHFADYGIDENSDSIIIRYTEDVQEKVIAEDGTEQTVTNTEDRELRIFIGNSSGDGYRYANMEGSDYVCKLAEDRIADMSIADPYVFEDDCPFNMDLTALSTIRVSAAEYSHQFAFTLDAVTNEEDGTASLETIYYMDGERLDDDRRNKFLGYLTDLTALKRASDRLNKDGDSSSLDIGFFVFSVDYEKDDGTAYNVCVYEYDESYYIVVVDNYGFYRIDRRDVDAVISGFEQI